MSSAGLPPESAPYGFDTILRSVADGVTVQDRSGRLIFANPAALRMMGFATLDELLATPLAEVVARFEILDEDGNPFPLERLPGRLVLAGEPSVPSIVRFRIRATGEERYSSIDAAPIPSPDGGVGYAVNTFHDITAVKHSEIALRFLADAGAALSASLDYEETLRVVARMAVPSVADWCVVDLLDEDGELRRVAIHHPNPDRIHLAEELQRRWPPRPDEDMGVYQVLRTGQGLFLPEISDDDLRRGAELREDPDEYLRVVRGLGLRSAIVVPLNGREATIGALTFVTAESGRRYGAADLAIAELLARRAALAVENARLYRTVEEAVGIRDRFMSMAAHELLTPVTVVRGYAQAIERQVGRSEDGGPPLDAERLRRTARQIDAASRRLTRLVNDLLDVTRLQRGTLTIEPTEMDLRDAVGAALDNVRLHVDEGRYPADVRLEVALPDAPLTGRWDPVRLEQVVFNLLDNAMKYSTPGGRVTVRVAGQERVAVEVVDQGIGIPADQLDRIFEPFHRATHGGGYVPGMGLGLAVCRQIVERHGGEIRAEPGPDGVGTRVVVELPRDPG